MSSTPTSSDSDLICPGELGSSESEYVFTVSDSISSITAFSTTVTVSNLDSNDPCFMEQEKESLNSISKDNRRNFNNDGLSMNKEITHMETNDDFNTDISNEVGGKTDQPAAKSIKESLSKGGVVANDKSNECINEPLSHSESEHELITNKKQKLETEGIKEQSTQNISGKVFLGPLSHNKVDIFVEDTGPAWYKTPESLVTRTVLPQRLVKAFEHLPVHGRARSKAHLEEFQNNKIREFVGCDLSDGDFDKLAKYCSPKHVETGEELKMLRTVPMPGVLPCAKYEREIPKRDANELCVIKKHRRRQENDMRNQYIVRLKYRSIRLMPFLQEDNDFDKCDPDRVLVPGKDLLYHIRVYRPFLYGQEKYSRGRTSVVSRTLMMAGRQTLEMLRDRLLCPNDLDVRLDVSQQPDDPPATCAKELFPSGFMFISNEFYVDNRPGCRDISAAVRAWAAARRLANFPKHDMKKTLDQVRVKLGHPEVYIHQGNCEHLFTVSEIRLVNASDPLLLSSYPYLTALSQNHTIYCTTCAEFGAKWIVTGCKRVPFDPAFFCETCFKLYLYKDGKKIDDFKAYSYMGNELNVLKTV